MAANDDLDDFFKKKDRKGNKHKKQTGLLTNNEELLKQLVIVTSATSAFKENLDFDEEDEEETGINRPKITDETNGINNYTEENQTVIQKSQPYSTTVNNKNKLTVQDNNHIHHKQSDDVEQQDEWEEFEGSNSNYNQLRLKFSQNNWAENEDNEEYDEDGNNLRIRTDENGNEIDDGDEDPTSRMNRRQQKDKHVWNMDQVKATESSIPTNDSVDSKVDKVEEAPASKPASTGAYRPPQLRGNSAVTIVSGINQRTSKKEKPNLASTEEFPTLGAAVTKK